MEEQDNTVAQSQPISAPKRAAREAEEPAAWVLVPREPTEAMIAASEAAMGEWRKTLTRDEALARSYMPAHGPRKFIASATPAEKHAIRYRAMIAAAPTSDSKHSEGGEGLTSSQSQPCSETGPNSPSSPRAQRFGGKEG